MKMGEAIRIARLQKDVRVPDEVLIQWVNQVEGIVQSDVLLVNTDDIMQYTERDMPCTLLVKPPHDKLYVSYLLSQIDLYNADYERYAYSKRVFDDDLLSFKKWFITAYQPADHLEDEENFCYAK